MLPCMFIVIILLTFSSRLFIGKPTCIRYPFWSKKVNPAADHMNHISVGSTIQKQYHDARTELRCRIVSTHSCSRGPRFRSRPLRLVILTEVFHDFPRSPKENSRKMPQIRHYCVLPYRIHIIIFLSFLRIEESLLLMICINSCCSVLQTIIHLLCSRLW
jgi:hypothetical protein